MSSRKDFKRQVAGQLGLLDMLAEKYDAGDSFAAIGMSSALRVLFKSRDRNAVSLLDHLNAQNIRLRSTVGGVARASQFAAELVFLELKPDDLIIDWKPYLGKADFHHEPFDSWWRQEVIWHDPRGTHLTREQLVLMIAEKEGGAHVDADSDQHYESMQDTWGIVVNPPHNQHGIVQNARYAAEANIRQICFEALHSPALARLGQ